VQHNQNANLRPNEKMIRTVCSACHGLGFSLDALADRSLVASNFRGKPLRSVAGIDMATTRIDRSPH
jgi:mono/diheme cytochrome c family protein